MAWIRDRRTGEWLTSAEYHARKYQDVAVSDLPRPMLRSDALDKPLRSMADGKMYDSKSALRATYMPSGNPQGARYVEMGNEDHKPKAPFKPDRKAVRHSVRKALSQVGIATA